MRRRHTAARPARALARAGALGALVVIQLGAASPAAAQDHTRSERTMNGSILVHITHGPEHPTRAALGFAVAEAALRQGRTVTLFLAGDGVQLLRQGVIDNLEGLGTGNLRQLHDALVAGGARFFASGGSSRARGLTQADLAGRQIELASPDRLVELAFEHDRVISY